MDYKFLGPDFNGEFLNNMSDSEREALCVELRDKILNTVSKNGGHLASNLGVVELTVAMLSVFDYKKDLFVFDVGHQSYSYKLLTERFEHFDTLRQKNGISGFPRISESKYDSFDTGHSSTSISAALGIARAVELKSEATDNNDDRPYVICVIGDGAMTGGLAYEAMNDAAHSNSKMLIILNDNEMSIDRNIGGLAKHLQNIRLSHRYIQAKRTTEKILKRQMPILGKPIISLLVAIKDMFRFILYRKKPCVFDDLGLVYYGPVNGNDTVSIIKALKSVREVDAPVLLHVCTKKGLGYKFAEENPSDYHGVGPFDIDVGVKSSGSMTYTKAFSESLINIAKKNDSVVAVCAAMASGTGLSEFQNMFPKRFFDCSIAEAHAVTMSGGLAVQGMIPVVAIYSTFLQRAFDSILEDVCFMNSHVVFCLDRAGAVGADGHTHNGLFDLSYMNMMPNMTIFSPRDYTELDMVLNYSINKLKGPCSIRYPRGSSPFESSEALCKEVDDVTVPHVVLDYGNEFALISFGRISEQAIKAVEKLNQDGLKGKMISLIQVKPLNISQIMRCVGDCANVYTLEEGILSGGIGSSISTELSLSGYNGNVFTLGFKTGIVHCATQDEQIRDSGLDFDSVASFIRKNETFF